MRNDLQCDGIYPNATESDAPTVSVSIRRRVWCVEAVLKVTFLALALSCQLIQFFRELTSSSFESRR